MLDFSDSARVLTKPAFVRISAAVNVSRERLAGLGSLIDDRYWEIIALPNIREQAAAIADEIARELNE